MIFDSDDNDGVLDWNDEGDDKPTPQPTTPPLPTRRAAKSPFGSPENGSVPQKPGNLPVRKPASPFGNPSGNRVQRPEPTRPAASEAPSKPFTRPAPAAPEVPSTRLPSRDFSNYLPPRQEEAPTPASEPEPEVLSEAEMILKAIREDTQARAEQARLDEEAAARLAQEQQANAVAPVKAETSPEPAGPAEPEVKTPKKGKGLFAAKPKAAKKGKAVAEPKENQYDGERKKILYIRLVAGSVAAIVGLAGLQAIFLPNSGPTKAQVISAAQEAVNYTGFPTVSGEQFAIDFSKVYFNYDSNDKTRTDSLSRFASPDLIKQIDINVMSPQEYDAQKKEGQPAYSAYAVKQTVTYGPYVVATNNLSATNAVFTVKVGINNTSVLYYDIPVKYDPKAYSLTLAGPPSFSKPIQNQGTATKDDWTAAFAAGSDADTVKAYQPDLEKYLSAWALSDSTTISRFVLDSATDNAKKGLQGAVQFNKIISLSIEPADPNNPKTATQRRVEVNVLWTDPATGLRYPQEYRMLIGMNPDKKWAVYDIENFYVLNKS